MEFYKNAEKNDPGLIKRRETNIPDNKNDFQMGEMVPSRKDLFRRYQENINAF